ncbi:MAG TPA: hypothetical protein VE131_04015 [Terriglobales bacterium]|nr:hypothetical protein [Terriglobales bacterium]
MLEVTVSDETGWEFDTLKRIYTNVGLDKNGETTLVAWKIAHPSPGSTALKPEETREEKLTFAVEPRDGKRFTVQARMLYFFAPPPQGGFDTRAGAAKMAETTLTIPGMRPS